MFLYLTTINLLLVVSKAPNEESVVTTNEKVLNKLNPNEFDPLQEKGKKIEENKNEHSNHGDVSVKETPMAAPAVPSVKTSNSQLNEYHTGTPVYGLFWHILLIY